eukprot:733991-Amphidinium_carterae.1
MLSRLRETTIQTVLSATDGQDSGAINTLASARTLAVLDISNGFPSVKPALRPKQTTKMQENTHSNQHFTVQQAITPA